MKNLLILSTRADLSLALLQGAASRLGLECTTIYFEDGAEMCRQQIGDEQYEFVYARDPFNTGEYNESEISELLEFVSSSQEKAYFVDNARSLEDVLIEDKWRQYQILGEFMPTTSLLESASQFNSGEHIIKKRVSSRAKGIYFEVNEGLMDGQHIIQPLLEIAEEYRVYAVSGKVADKVSIRSSKTAGSKVKALRVTDIDRDVREFSEKVLDKLPGMDLVGLDIVRTTDDQLKLIEANRSCQFARFTQLSSVNLAELMLDTIVGKH